MTREALSVPGLASACSEACFALFSTAGNAQLLREDVRLSGEVAGILQPVLGRLAAREEAGNGSSELLAALGQLRSALELLDKAACRCRASHWLLRVLVARDARLAMAGAISATQAALKHLVQAASSVEGLDLSEVEELQSQLACHRVGRHGSLEGLARGLYKHMFGCGGDPLQIKQMLRFVVAEAANSGRPGRTSNASSTDDGAGSSSAASKAAAPPDGQTALSDSRLVLEVEALAEAKSGDEQAALLQIVSILDDHLQGAKRKRRSRRIAPSSNCNGPANPLSCVPEGADDDVLIPAARDQQHTAHLPPLATPAAADGPGGEPVLSYRNAMLALTTQLVDLLAADPWDVAALTQLLELLLQVGDSAPEQQSALPPRPQQAPVNTESEQPGRRWWRSFSVGGAKAGAAPASKQLPAGKEREMQALRHQRLKQLAASALDSLLSLTPRPPGMHSFSKSLALPGLSPGRSLAVPLLRHCDTLPALLAALWSGWPDVASKAASLLAVLVASAETAARAGAADAHAAFCSALAGSNTIQGEAYVGDAPTQGVWWGLVALLHSPNFAAAGAAAEAIAALASSSHTQLCAPAEASQIRTLLVLLARFSLHPGAAGAAAAALAALARPEARPELFTLLAASFFDSAAAVGQSLAELLQRVMTGADPLAAVRAARLASLLAPGISWDRRAAAWVETFRAGLHLFQAGGGASCSGVSQAAVAGAGAQLLDVLVLGDEHSPNTPPVFTAAVDVAQRDEILLETLQLLLLQLQGPLGSVLAAAAMGDEPEPGAAQAVISLAGALLQWAPDDGLCACLPTAQASLQPLLATAQHSASPRLAATSARVYEQLLGLGA